MNLEWLSMMLVTVCAAVGFDEMRTADLVIRHARVLTLDAGSQIAQAVAIRGDRILAVGTDDEIQRLIGPGTKTIDAGGKTLLPGLYDSHVHPLGAAHSEADHPIPVFESLADVMDYISDRVKAQPKGTWIVARYAFPTPLAESRFLTRAELDRIAPEHMVLHQGGPAGVVNSKALAHSGMTRDTPDPPAGQIVKDPRTGEPTGMLRNAYSVLKDLPSDAYGDDGTAGRPACETAVLEIQRARDHQHRGPGSERRGLEALPLAPRSRRTDRTDQRHADAEPALW